MNAFATVEDIRKALTISPKEISAGAANKVIWQVFFLPIDDVNNPSGYAAFCPFTKILAYGSTINEAAQRWTRKAQREYKYLGAYSPSFIIPKYSLTTRKVWLGNLPEDMIQEEHALRSQPQPKQRTTEDESGLDEDLLEEVAQERSIQSVVAQEDMPVFLVDWVGVKKGVAVWPARGAVSAVGLGQDEESSEFSAANHVPRWAWLGTVMDWAVTATPAQSHSLPTAMIHAPHLRTGMTLTPNVIN